MFNGDDLKIYKDTLDDCTKVVSKFVRLDGETLPSLIPLNLFIISYIPRLRIDFLNPIPFSPFLVSLARIESRTTLPYPKLSANPFRIFNINEVNSNICVRPQVKTAIHIDHLVTHSSRPDM